MSNFAGIYVGTKFRESGQKSRKSRNLIPLIQIFPYNSRSKDNQKMKLGQLKNTLRETFFFKNYAESKTGKLVFCFLEKLNMR